MNLAEIFGWLSPAWAVWVATGVVVLALAFFKLGPAGELKERATRLPETSMGFSKEELSHHVAEINRTRKTYNRDAHQLYAKHLLVDSLFAALYATGIALVVAAIWVRVPGEWARWLGWAAVAAPLVMGGSDILENWVLWRALRGIDPTHSKHSSSPPDKHSSSPPDKHSSSPPRWSTRVKWAAGGLTALLLLAGALAMSRSASAAADDPEPPIRLMTVKLEYPSHLNNLDRDYSPNPIEISASVSNAGAAPLTDVEVAIALPLDLTANNRVAPRRIGSLRPGETKQVSWRVRVRCTSNKKDAKFSVTAVGLDVPRAHAVGRLMMPVHPQGHPILLTHGFQIVSRTNLKRTWGVMTEALRKWGWCGPIEWVGYYKRDKHFTISVDPYRKHEDVFPGRRHKNHTVKTDIRHLAYHWAWMVYDEYAKKDRTIEVVGHSMGGVIIRYALAQVNAGDPRFPPHLAIEDAVSFGTPHAGSRLAKACRRVLFLLQCEQLQPHSDFMELLRRKAYEPAQLGRIDWTAIGSDRDGTVKGRDSAVAIDAMHRILYLEGNKIAHNDYMKTVSAKRSAQVVHWLRGGAEMPMPFAPYPVRWAHHALLSAEW